MHVLRDHVGRKKLRGEEATRQAQDIKQGASREAWPKQWTRARAKAREATLPFACA